MHLARLLAVLLPIALSVGVGGALLSPQAPATDPVLADRDLRRLSLHLSRVQPEVVVLGNSVAHRNLDRAALGAGLGAPDRVASLWLVGSDAPTWLVLLDRLLYGAGHRPRLVLIPAFTASFVQTRPLSDVDVARVEAAIPWLSPPVARALGGAGNRWEHLRIRRQAWRDGLVRAVRDPILAAVGGADPDDVLDAALDVDDPAAGFGPVPADDVAWVEPAASLLPDLVDLVRANGGEPVLVQMPIRADRAMLLGDAAARNALAGWCADNDLRYVDLSGVPLHPDRFLDGLHVDLPGKRKVTDALLAALHDDAPAVASAPAPPVVTRSGSTARADPPTAAELAPFGLRAAVPGSPPSEAFPLPVEADGAMELPGLTPSRTGASAFWVYPGTVLRASFPDGGGLPAGFSALPFGGSAPPEVVGVEVHADGEVLRGAGVAPPGPWELTLSSPPDGPWLLVRNLWLGSGPSAVWAVGTEGTARSSASLLAGTAAFAGPPPEVPQSPAVHGGRGPWIGVVEAWLAGPLGLDRITARSPLYACTPLRVSYDGELLPIRRFAGPGVATVGDGRAAFGTPDGTDVVPERARLVLDPDRRCDRYFDDSVPGGVAANRPFLRRDRAEARWLYPGDRATFAAPAVGLHAPADTVELRAWGYGEPTVTLAVWAGGEELARATVADLHGRPVEVPLSRRVAVGDPVEVALASDGYVQVVRLRLVESPVGPR